MRQYICIAICLIATQLSAAIKVTFPDSFTEGWEPYIGQTIEFTTHSMFVATTMTRSFSPPSDFMYQKSMLLD